MRLVPLKLLLTGVLLVTASAPGFAQNPDKKKSGVELFRTNCALCHRRPQAVGTSMGSWALTGFLTVHYTTSRATAAIIAGYLNSLKKDEKRPPRRRRPQGPKRSELGEPAPGGDGVAVLARPAG